MSDVKEAVSISLIIPVYKVAPYVERCLKTVMSQTWDRFECILVDDASPDDNHLRYRHAEYGQHPPQHLPVKKGQYDSGYKHQARNDRGAP